MFANVKHKYLIPASRDTLRLKYEGQVIQLLQKRLANTFSDPAV